MFIKLRIWKQAFAGSLIATLLLLGLTPLLAGPAQAAGETYSWANTDRTQITATGGNFGTASTIFIRSTSANGGATFGATKITYDCGGAAQTGDLTISLPGPSYATATNVNGNVIGPDSKCNFGPVALAVSATTPGGPTGAGQCDQGSLTWLMCPVIDNISGAISGLAKSALEPLLRVNRVTPTTTPGLYATWQRVRDVTNVLFILVFLTIIYSTALGQDVGGLNAYTIRTTWVRLIIAAILVQLSFGISGLIVDIGNVLGAGVDALFRGALNPSSGDASWTNFLANIGTIVGGLTVAGGTALIFLTSWAAILPILLTILISLLVVFLTLGARYLIIAILIAVSPLAFVAMVLPNTRKWLGSWFEVFARLVFMYPMIIGILSLAGMVNQLLSFSPGGPGGGTTDSGPAFVAAWLIKPIIVIAAFLIIPFSFRFAGRGLALAHGLLTTGAQQSRGRLKDSPLAQQGKADRDARRDAYMRRVTSSKAITSLGNAGAGGRVGAGLLTAGAGLALANGPKTSASRQRLKSSVARNIEKQLKDLDEAQNPVNLHNAVKAVVGRTAAERSLARTAAKRDAPNLLQAAYTPAGLEVITGMLADKGFLNKDDANQAAEATKTRNPFRAINDPAATYASLIGNSQKVRKEQPGSVIRVTKADPDYKLKNALGNTEILRDATNTPILDRQGNEIEASTYRQVGDIDLNAATEAFRNMGGADLAKLSPENTAVMLRRTAADATDLEKRAARDLAAAAADGIDSKVINRAFDINNRHAISLKSRLNLVLGFRENKDQFDMNSAREAKYQAIQARFNSDTELTIELAQAAGMPSYMAEGLAGEPETLAAIARHWMDGYEYTDNVDDYRPPSILATYRSQRP